MHGQIQASGAKNAVLPIMAATLLAEGIFHIHNVPDLRDVKTMAYLLRIIGAKVDYEHNTLTIDTSNCSFFEAPYELVKTMRASIYVLGPLLARFGEAKVSLPGGCAIGARPVDLHLKGLSKLGACVVLEKGYIQASANQMAGCTINLDVPSVGATGNLLMAAVLTTGETTISNAAREPDVVALAEFLVKMGARIEGIGTAVLKIKGAAKLNAVDFEIVPDRIEAGTFMIAAAITGGEVEITKCNPRHVDSLTAKLREAGVLVEEGKESITCKSTRQRPLPVNITTSEYPGFPTDLQAQWMALMCLAGGSSIITDTIFFDRFTHTAELRRLGAKIELNENTAFVGGVESLNGAPVMSTDLRASACLVLAGLAARGCTEVHRIYHLDRGYERIEAKLKKLGADISRQDGGL